MVGGADSAVSTCRPLFDALAVSIGAAPRTNDTDGYILYPEEYGWIYAGPAGAGHFVKMVHNGIEYGIMQAYAEGFNILHEAAGSVYVKAGDAEVAPMENPKDYCYDIDVAKVAECWRRGSVVGSWLLDLTADVLRRDGGLVISLGASPIVGKVVGLSMLLLWTLAYPLLSSVVRCGHVLSRAVLVLSRPRF